MFYVQCRDLNVAVHASWLWNVLKTGHVGCSHFCRKLGHYCPLENDNVVVSWRGQMVSLSHGCLYGIVRWSASLKIVSME